MGCSSWGHGEAGLAWQSDFDTNRTIAEAIAAGMARGHGRVVDTETARHSSAQRPLSAIEPTSGHPPPSYRVQVTTRSPLFQADRSG
jgi:hypothetical protein